MEGFERLDVRRADSADEPGIAGDIASETALHEVSNGAVAV
jgi:hypothetical protein